jgi:hypothetical protein
VAFGRVDETFVIVDQQDVEIAQQVLLQFSR